MLNVHNWLDLIDLIWSAEGQDIGFQQMDNLTVIWHIELLFIPWKLLFDELFLKVDFQQILETFSVYLFLSWILYQSSHKVMNSLWTTLMKWLFGNFVDSAEVDLNTLWMLTCAKSQLEEGHASPQTREVNGSILVWMCWWKWWRWKLWNVESLDDYLLGYGHLTWTKRIQILFGGHENVQGSEYLCEMLCYMKL